MKNRSRYEVIAAILKSVNKEETRTKIMYKAMLSNDQCKLYLDSLIKVFGDAADQFRVIQRDVAPEHQAAVVRLQNFAHAPEVFEIDRAHAARFHLFAALPLAEFKRLVSTDVKKFSREQLVYLFVPIGDEPERAFLLRREHVAVRHFGEFVVRLEL